MNKNIEILWPQMQLEGNTLEEGRNAMKPANHQSQLKLCWHSFILLSNSSSSIQSFDLFNIIIATNKYGRSLMYLLWNQVKCLQNQCAFLFKISWGNRNEFSRFKPSYNGGTVPLFCRWMLDLQPPLSRTPLERLHTRHWHSRKQYGPPCHKVRNNSLKWQKGASGARSRVRANA